MTSYAILSPSTPRGKHQVLAKRIGASSARYHLIAECPSETAASMIVAALEQCNVGPGIFHKVRD